MAVKTFIHRKTTVRYHGSKESYGFNYKTTLEAQAEGALYMP